MMVHSRDESPPQRIRETRERAPRPRGRHLKLDPISRGAHLSDLSMSSLVEA